MDDVIALGIDAKHPTRIALRHSSVWIELYGNRIGLLGGIDLDILAKRSRAEVYEIVLECGRRYRRMTKAMPLERKFHSRLRAGRKLLGNGSSRTAVA